MSTSINQSNGSSLNPEEFGWWRLLRVLGWTIWSICTIVPLGLVVFMTYLVSVEGESDTGVRTAILLGYCLVTGVLYLMKRAILYVAFGKQVKK
jgi:hypothetical protein